MRPDCTSDDPGYHARGSLLRFGADVGDLSDLFIKSNPAYPPKKAVLWEFFYPAFLRISL